VLKPGLVKNSEKHQKGKRKKRPFRHGKKEALKIVAV